MMKQMQKEGGPFPRNGEFPGGFPGGGLPGGLGLYG